MALPSPNKRGFPLRRVIVIVILILLASAAWFYTRPKPVSVALTRVERGTVEAAISNTRAGTIKACHRAKMSPPAGGQISHLKVKKGERVKVGQVLLELWNEDLQAQERLAQEQMATAQIQAYQACTQAAQADKDMERAQQLRVKGFISSEGVEQKILASKTSRTGCDAARSQVEQSRSRVETAKATLDRLVLRAPFAGIVADISGELGEYATPSPPGIPTPPAIDLIDDSCMFVSAPIDEVDASAVKVGQRSRITLDALKGKQFAGKVTRIAPYVIDLEKQARTVEVEAGFDEPPQAGKLLVGYSADIEIIHDAHEKVLRVPTATLLEGKRVLLYRADGVLEERSITAGLANWEYTEIVSGLNEGDQIVLSLDRAGVKAGAKVQAEAGK
ncbi:MAG: efflux RND transporter periplasmic adaptor subunit [Nitrosomonadales bacterium]|nr:efflux RND transporter periplasmic adaptor subunit [Nitrosomonadales bacterium]